MTEPKSKMVLIVEDDESVRQLLQHFLSNEGFLTELAGTVKEARRRLASGSPDLIVLDLMLPGGSGFEIIRELQNDDRPRIPIIVITGRFTDPNNEEMIRLESNVAEFLKKPVHYPHFVSLVHRILKTKSPKAA